ncbi:MAG: hydantoinase/oxoprolinase family protein [Alphaproteobacteria bacterium]|nr:hydantoinase/oxoprolinase family protein [Alphaproteobacteria bacterium]
MFRIGIDVGGTFTDLVAVDDDGGVTFAKSPSTPADQSIGVMEGLARLADALGLGLEALLAQTQRIVHGTTVATNALLERKGATVGLLTTEGHRDILEMREGLKPDRYNMRMPRAEPLVPRDRRLGVRERIRPEGTVEIPLDPGSVADAIATLRAKGANSVAICYLHAYKDAAHEQATAAMVRDAMPEAYVCLSSDVFPQIKEYERVSTTAVNAYVGPALDRYLSRLERRLAEAGYGGPVLIILSHGGVAPIAEAIRLAAATVLSGPAGGVAGARYAARLMQAPNLIPFDMGGTSTDISLIAGGEATLSADRGIADQRIALQSLDIASIGAGGGSLASVDASGLLKVGPESAGADPGPACYGRGGTQATVTDASAVLGFFDPANFLGGTATLDAAAADAALDALAAGLGVTREQAAEGVHRVINTQMAEGVRLVSVRRGIDPRQFALLSFGGAAGLHVTEVARQLGVTRAIAPRVASVLSAWGMLATDLRFEASRTHIGDTGALDADAVRATFDALKEDATQRLSAVFDGPVAHRFAADMRYGEQIFEIDVPLDDLDWQAPDMLAQIAERFHVRHEALYTYALRDQEAVLVNARVAAIGRLPALPQEPLAAGGRHEAPPSAHREVYLGGWHETPIYAWDRLVPGQEIVGPAVLESATTTLVLRAGDRATVTPHLWIDIAVGATH